MKRTQLRPLVLGGVIAVIGCFLFFLFREQRFIEPQARLVLFYATCTVNKDYLAPYRNTIRYTPNLLKFADESIVFTKHVTEAPFSGAAYASLFSGTFVYKHGVYYHPARLSEKNYLLSEAFRDQGFETFFWNQQYCASADLGYAQGILPENVIQNWPGNPKVLNSEDPRFLSILKRLRKDKSYRAFVQVGFTMTHAPYQKNSDPIVTQQFCKIFPEECQDITDEDIVKYLALYEKNHIPLSFKFDETVRSLQLQPADISKLVKVLDCTYKSSIHRLDRNFGMTLVAIRSRQLFDQSLIVFTADHGEILYREDSPKKWGHGVLEPEVLNVPLIVRLPGVSDAGTVYKHVTRSVDVFPTVAALSKIKLSNERQLDGVDLSPFIFNEQHPSNLTAYSVSESGHPAVWKTTPQQISVQARWRDNIFKFVPYFGINVFELGEDTQRRRIRFDQNNPKHIEIKKNLEDYRSLLIQNYPERPDQSDWKDVRDRLRGLGYIN